MTVKVAPSILTCDFENIDGVIKELEESGADYIHLDVMDGKFVPPTTFDCALIKKIRSLTRLTLDTHLMIVEPEKYVEDYVRAGSDIVTFHYEAAKERSESILRLIKSAGCKCGIVISPDTPVSAVTHLLPLCDMFLIMSVHPGYGGQKFIENSIDKLKEAREFIDNNCPYVDLEVDGGVGLGNVKLIKQAGANVLVAGSSVINSTDKKATISALKAD